MESDSRVPWWGGGSKVLKLIAMMVIQLFKLKTTELYTLRGELYDM